jgi:hypothetical protein
VRVEDQVKYKKVEFQLKESSRYKKLETNTSGIGHRSQEVGRNTSSRMMNTKHALNVM